MLLLTLLLALSGSLVRYEVTESVTATTPRGEQASAMIGRVTVSSGSARWEVEGGTFPRTSAQAAIADRGAVTLLDRETKAYASASREEFRALFVPDAAPQAGAAFTARDVIVAVTPVGPGATFAGNPTVRYRVTASWRLAMQIPGRAGSVVTKLQGTIVSAADLDDARSPFDDLLRLFPARGEVKEALEQELARVQGLPVKVELTMESEAHLETLGALPGAVEHGTKPQKTVTRVERTLSGFERRAARAEDAALFAVPESFRSRSLERLAPAATLP